MCLKVEGVLPLYPDELFPLFQIERKMMSDASEMLAAALEQMDGIIAGNLSKSELLFKWPFNGVYLHLEIIK